MKELTRWFELQTRREQRTPRLEDALIGNRFWRYAWYRLRYFFARYVARCLVDGIKFVFLYQIFSRRAFVGIVFGHALVGFLSSFWWGALEAMRSRVRGLRRNGRPDLISGEVTRWLSLAGSISTLIVAAAVGWLCWFIWYQQQPFGISQLYVLTLFLRLALESITRTLHSGIYAVRRVYRPFWAMIAIEFVGFAATLSLWPWLGRWSFLVGTIVSLVMVTLLTLRYTLESYRFIGISAKDLLNVKRLAFRPPGPLGEFTAAGLSYAVVKLDSFLVLGLFAISSSHARTELFVLFFIIGPTIQAGFDWAQLFYFDLKRLGIAPYNNLRIRYEHLVFRLSWLLGSLFWGFGCLTATVITQRNLGVLTWLLAPFFLSRSLLGFEQIRAFSLRRYGELLKSAVLWLVGFCVISAGIADDRAKLVVLSIVTITMFVVLRRSSFNAEPDTAVEPLSLFAWLARVNDVKEVVRIHAVDLSEDDAGRGPDSRRGPAASRWRCHKLAGRMARRLNRSGQVTIIQPNRIAWYQRGSRRPTIDETWLIRMGAGFVSTLRDTGSCPDGRSALRRACDWHLAGTDLSLAADGSTLNVTQVTKSFAALCPGGVVYSPDRIAPAFFDHLPPRERRRIMAEAVAFPREVRQNAKPSRFDVTALSVAGDLRLIFVVERRFDRRARDRWRSLIKQLNVDAALGAVVD